MGIISRIVNADYMGFFDSMVFLGSVRVSVVFLGRNVIFQIFAFLCKK